MKDDSLVQRTDVSKSSKYYQRDGNNIEVFQYFRKTLGRSAVMLPSASSTHTIPS